MLPQSLLKRKSATEDLSYNKRGPAIKSTQKVSDEDSEDDHGLAIGCGQATIGQPQDFMADSQHFDDEDDMASDDEQDLSNEMNDVDLVAGPSKSKGLYKPPTISEMEMLRGTETGGTAFSLQLSELLESTLLPITPQSNLKTLLSTLHDALLNILPLSPLPPQKAVKRLNGVKIPFPGPEEFNPLKKSKDVKWTLGWERPEEVIIGGSWGVVGGWKKIKGEMGGIDLVVVMPHNLFSAKDRLDYRYFHKRVHYLAVIFYNLQRLSMEDGPLSGVKLRWSIAMGDERRPVILLSAGKDQGLRYRTEIQIQASIPPNLFQTSSLAPSKSLVRTTTSSDETISTPTPLYNTSILHDTLQKPHLLHLHRLHQGLSPSTRTMDSYLALWRIWARRRAIPIERGGSGWLARLILQWVTNGGWIGGVGGKRGSIHKVNGLGIGLSVWAILRATWEFLAHTDFRSTPIFLHAPPTSPSGSFSHDQFLQFDQVFTEPAGLVNVFAEWLPGEIDYLKYHARATLAILEDDNRERFSDVFLRDFTFGPGVFDEFLQQVQVDLSSAKFEANLDQRSEYPSTLLVKYLISSTLTRGFSDRVALIFISLFSNNTLHIGLMLDSTHSIRILDTGPSSEQIKEGEEFRALWGDKAELRRFKDGSIVESIVWDISRPEDAGLIPGRILKYLLKRHYSIPEENILSFSTNQEWLKIVQVPSSAREGVNTQGSEKQGFRLTMSAYDQLYRILKDLGSELPLDILNVQPSSSLLRYSSTFVPHPLDVNRYKAAPECIQYVPFAEVIVQFESSPRWPDDLAAVQKVKLALFGKLAGILKERLPHAHIAVVFNHDGSEIEDHTALEILLPEGVAFRLRVFYEREQTMLQRAVDEEHPIFATSLPLPQKRIALPALAKHLQLFHYLPAHHSALSPLHHRYPSYSAATRLLKRWFAAHLLLGQVSEEAVELVMASVYLDPGLGRFPSSATSGFFRSLELFTSWDWKNEPLLVPIITANSFFANSASDCVPFPNELRREAVKYFESLRAKEKGAEGKGKLHPWIVVTESDIEGRRWTKGVGKAIAIRISVLAKASLTAMHNSIAHEALDVQGLFMTPVSDYDFLLHLSPTRLTRSHLAVSPNPSLWEPHLRYHNLPRNSSKEDAIKIGFDPAESFVNDLRKIYGDNLLFFHDIYGGSFIAGVWNPKMAARGQKAYLGWSSKPVQSDAELVEVNRDGILGEIARLGKGLVEKIERRR
nr:hypothetical protein L204_02372 [Cryptococcus depauperatus CBS 7855]